MNSTNDDARQEETSDINTLNTFIRKGSCVLLLGPLFALDKQGNKVHKGLHDFLTNPPYRVSLDNEFDNLYISTKADGSENARILTGVTNFYDTIEGNSVYDDLLNIGFQSIISFSFDLFLYKANEEVKEYDFYFFNRKGSISSQENVESYLVKPIIYNVFGDIRDMNTLIVDYDSLYDFLIKIITADSQIPLQLKDIIGKANAFLFLGFDLSRWYIPILIRKLNQYITNNRSKGSISCYACIDDTAALPSVNMFESLNKYPIQFTSFRYTNTQDLINLLQTKPKNGYSVLDSKVPITTEQLEFFERWKDDATSKDASTTLNDFFTTSRQMGIKGEIKNLFDGSSIKYKSLEMEFHSEIMDRDEFLRESIKIVKNVMAIIDTIMEKYKVVN